MSEQQHAFHNDGEQPLSEDFTDGRFAELERVWRRMALDLGYFNQESQPDLRSEPGA